MSSSNEDFTKDFATFRKKIPHADYNDWFIFFQKRSKAENLACEEWATEHLPSDGYTALARWLEIYDNSNQMDKIAKAKMEDDNIDELLKLATGENDEDYYVAEIENLFRQAHSSGIAPQEYARLSALMSKARENLREVRARRPKEDSPVGKFLSVSRKIDAKRQNSRKSPAKKSIQKKTAKRSPAPVKTTALKAAGAAKKKKTVSRSPKEEK